MKKKKHNSEGFNQSIFPKHLEKAWDKSIKTAFGKAIAIEQTGARMAGKDYLRLGKALFTKGELIKGRKRSIFLTGV